jgi:phage terminase small subunit
MRHRGGSKLREYATQPELDFLNYVLDGALKTDAARRAGLSKGVNLTNLLRRPLIAQTFAELQEKRKDQSIEAAERRREERAEFLHQELMHRLRTAVTHERTGDLGIAKMLEVGFKSTGEIQATKVKCDGQRKRMKRDIQL